MNDQKVKDTLSSARTIAIVGAKDDRGAPVNNVGRYLIQAGYEVIPVHPKRETVWGLKAYPNLDDIPYDVDIVDVFRAPEYCAAHAQEAAGMTRKPELFWMQLGISDEQAKRIAEENGIDVVEDACLMVQHNRLLG